MAVCPECKFNNLAKQQRCLMCKADLPEEEPATEPHPDHTRTLSRAAQLKLEKPAPAASSYERENIDLDTLVGWIVCEPLLPIPLAPGSSMLIGRSSDADLVLRAKGVSRKHAMIKVLGKTMQLEDLGSANGTFLNGKRMPRATLRAGDVVSIGTYEIHIQSRDSISSLDDDGLDADGTAVLAPTLIASGTLRPGALAEVLQGFEFNEKTGTLKIMCGTLRGTLVVEAGKPLWAAVGSSEDQEAIFRMLDLVEGRYTFSSVLENDDQRRISLTITGLLLEASRRLDQSMDDIVRVDNLVDSRAETSEG